MKKINTMPISGMQELLPNLQNEFDRFKNGFLAKFHAHGFQSIETPIIDRTEILLAKAGGDTEKQIYKVVKTAEDPTSSDQALRFDHTVPLARYVVEHESELTFPFKVTQIGRNFRGERPQKGRYREFYQCDIDVIGRNDLSVYYDAEVIATLIDAVQILPISNLIVRISNRKLLSGLIEELGLIEKSLDIFSIIDHAEKIPFEKTLASLRDLGIPEENVVKITTFMGIAGPIDEVKPKLEALECRNETFQTGINELTEVMEMLELKLTQTSTKNGASSEAEDTHIRADMLIVRGLDYYTGTVFETFAADHREIGSLCSGGRYENLASNYTDQKFPGVGGSIGLTRLFWILQNNHLIDIDTTKSIDVCIIPFSSKELAPAEHLARNLRESGQNVDIIMTDKKLGDKLKYASKIAKYATVIGENEVKTGEYGLKNLETGEKELRKF